MERKRYVTARIVSNNSHIIIDAENPLGCFKVAQELHKLGESKIIQVRLRSTPASKKSYKWLKLEDILNGA